MSRPGDQPLLSIRNLTVHFGRRPRLASRTQGRVRALDDVSFDVEATSIVGIVGESGSGKSTLARAIVRDCTAQSGEIMFEGQDVLQLDRRGLRAFRRQVQLIFQDPAASLTPHMTLGELVGEPFTVHRRSLAQAARTQRIDDLLELCGLSGDFKKLRPGQLSGGQQQRVAIARALAVEPRLLIADEPVSALDVSMKAQMTELLQDLRETLRLTIVIISHDIAHLVGLADSLMVMYAGKIVESGPAWDVITSPQHPYTKALLSAVPIPDPAMASRHNRFVLHGEMPSPIHPPPGCRFHTRCPLADERCMTDEPPLETFDRSRKVACWHRGEPLTLDPAMSDSAGCSGSNGNAL